MAITSRRISGAVLGGWLSLGSESYAAITDIAIQNLGTSDAYITTDPSIPNAVMAPFKVPAGQVVTFEGLSFADLSSLYISDFGTGTEIGIIEISR
jgi:hypothetical protein